MQNGHSPKPLVISGYSSQDFSARIAQELGSRLAQVSYKKHDDGEISTTLDGNVRNRDVVVVASASGSPNTQEKETRLLMRAARQGGAKSITLVLPYMFYGRSDSSFDTRSAPALADTIYTLRGLCDNVIVMDPHNPGLTDALFKEASNMKSSTMVNFAYPFAVQVRDLFNQQVISRHSLMLTYPDVGASKRITRNFRQCVYGVLDLPMNPERSDEWTQVMKTRDHRTGAINVSVNADVTGRDIVVFEDMIASGGTACDIAALLKERGARTVTLFASSGLFTAKKARADKAAEHPLAAVRRIDESALDAVFITDTYDHRLINPGMHQAIADSNTIHVLPTAPFVAGMLKLLHMEVTEDMQDEDNSISALLRGQHAWQQDPAQTVAQAVPLKAGCTLRMPV